MSKTESEKILEEVKFPVDWLKWQEKVEQKWISTNLIDPNPFWTRKTLPKIKKLAQNLQQHGQLQSVLVRPHPDIKGRYQLVCGHRRLEAIKHAKIPKIRAGVAELTDQQMLEFAVSENLQREDVNMIDEGEGYREMHEQLGYTYKEVGLKVGEDEESIKQAVRLLNLGKGAKSEVRCLTSENPLFHHRDHFTPLLQIKDEEKQAELAHKIIYEQWTVAKIRKAVKKLTEGAKPIPSLPEGIFDVIYADPPWQYEFSLSERGDPEQHFSVMNLEDICNLEVYGEKITEKIAEDAILFLWATNPKLKEALKVIEAWGFEYKTNMVWVKDKIGTGYYFRGKHELLLVAKKGDIPAPEESDRYPSVLEAPRRKHSEKPLEIYERIEKMYPNRKYLELFATKEREGWTTWGKGASEKEKE